MTRSLALAALASLALGCGSSDDELAKLGPLPIYPVPGCEALDHRPCDIGTSPCRERLMELAACLRGSEPLPVPPIATMTTAEFAAYLNERFAEDPPPEPNHYETALTLLGLVEPGGLGRQAMVEDDLEFVWGIYRFATKDIIIVDHGVPADGPDPNSVLLHEFVHALQDADVDLLRFYDEYSTSYDSYLAVAAVSEGEAFFHQSRFWSSLLGLDPGKVDWSQRLQERVEFAEETALQAPSPYTASYALFPYDFGARFVHHAWVASGSAGVDALFASPPTRSVAVMASETGLESAAWPSPEFPTLDAPAPWTPWTEASLGAWGSLLYLTGLTTHAPARDAALDLVGDRLLVYTATETSTETAAVWHLEFGSEETAATVEGLVRGERGAVARAGNRVVLVVSTGTDPLDWALAP